MALIDPEGLFSGDRMEMLSDEAKLYWPYFWCASNTVGRIELSYRKILGRAFHHFKVPPSEERFWAIAREYRDCYLLFIYKHQGQVWGQWDTSERYLPKYKLTTDERTPAPPPLELSEWKKRYIAAKEALHSDKSNADNLFTKVLKECETFSEISAQNATERRGIGSGIGSGEEKEKENTPQPPSGGLSVAAPPDTRKVRSAKRTTSQIETALGTARVLWWKDFWSIYPCHDDKRAAMDAFERAIASPEIWEKVRAGALRYRQRAAADPEMRLKFGQGWINGERWEDEYSQPVRASPMISKSDRSMEIFMENMAAKVAKENSR